MKTLFLALVVVFCSLPVSAQEKVVDKKFIFTSTFLIGTTVFDTESTFAALDQCNGACEEGNSLMRPFINSGRPATFVVQGAIDTGLIAWSYKLKKDGNKLWWFPPVVVGVTHGLAGGFNLRFVW